MVFVAIALCESKVNQVHNNVACCWILETVPHTAAGASKSHTVHYSLRGEVRGGIDLQTERGISLRKLSLKDFPFIFFSRTHNLKHKHHARQPKLRHQKRFPSWQITGWLVYHSSGQGGLMQPNMSYTKKLNSSHKPWYSWLLLLQVCRRTLLTHTARSGRLLNIHLQTGH